MDASSDSENEDHEEYREDRRRMTAKRRAIKKWLRRDHPGGFGPIVFDNFHSFSAFRAG
jgi:hypothetical protein